MKLDCIDGFVGNCCSSLSISIRPFSYLSRVRMDAFGLLLLLWVPRTPLSFRLDRFEENLDGKRLDGVCPFIGDWAIVLGCCVCIGMFGWFVSLMTVPPFFYC